MKGLSFSKLILAAVMLCFFLGVLVGGVLVILHPEYLDYWLVYIGAPTAVAIGFYSWKAKAENLSKYSKPVREKIENIQ